MNKLDIENRLNELKGCNRVFIVTSDNMHRNVYYSSIINDTKNNRLIFDVNPPVAYSYQRILSIQNTL